MFEAAPPQRTALRLGVFAALLALSCASFAAARGEAENDDSATRTRVLAQTGA